MRGGGEGGGSGWSTIVSLVYIIGTNIETQEKKCRTSIYRTESRHIH